MVNLVNPKLPRKSFEISDKDRRYKFVMFVEKTQNSHSCTILVLLYDEEN